MLSIQIRVSVKHRVIMINCFLGANRDRRPRLTTPEQNFVSAKRACGVVQGSEVLFCCLLQRNTCLLVQERGRCCWEPVLSLQLSLSHPLKCVTFLPTCVIQCGNALCSPGEPKQLTAPLIHAGALNSFCTQHLTGVLRREMICL